MTWSDVWAALQPAVLMLLSTVVTIAITVGASALQRRANIMVEQVHREALHSAVMTGVQAAMAKLGSAAPIGKISRETVTHVQSSVPEALAALRPTGDTLHRLIESKIVSAKAAASPDRPIA